MSLNITVSVRYVSQVSDRAFGLATNSTQQIDSAYLHLVKHFGIYVNPVR